MAVNTSTGYCAALLGPHAFEDIFLDGVIEVRTGVQPASADDAPSGTLVARVTRDGGLWTPGSSVNGLRFTRQTRYAMKYPSHRWVLSGIAEGVAGWFRLLGNAADPGTFSTEAPRIDGAIGLDPELAGIQMVLPITDIAAGTSIELGDWWYELP